MTWHKINQPNSNSRVVVFKFLETWNSHKDSAIPRLKKPCLLSYLPNAGGRIAGFIPFPGILALWEMSTASFRFWTHYELIYSVKVLYECISSSFWQISKVFVVVFAILFWFNYLFLNVHLNKIQRWTFSRLKKKQKNKTTRWSIMKWIMEYRIR